MKDHHHGRADMSMDAMADALLLKRLKLPEPDPTAVSPRRVR